MTTRWASSAWSSSSRAPAPRWPHAPPGRFARASTCPRRPSSYLESHGDLDIGHLAFFEGLIERLDDADDLQAVIDTANMVYRLYGAMFRGLNTAAGGRTEALDHALV